MAVAMRFSAFQDLLHWWLMSELYQRRFAIDDECSLLKATPPRPEATAATAASRVTIVVTGTWPLKKDSSPSTICGSRVRDARTMSSPVTAAVASSGAKRPDAG